MITNVLKIKLLKETVITSEYFVDAYFGFLYTCIFIMFLDIYLELIYLI